MRVLVIDDDELAAEMTAAISAEHGHETAIAGSAAEGMGLLEQDPRIDVVVCDLHMPQMDGLALLRHLRQRGRAVPFVLLSGDEPGAALRGEPGLDQCLVKDAMLEQTLGEALAAIGTRQAPQAG
jgi:CheY-like chemotaxis protein